MIKVIQVANSDIKGGASRAAYRIHRCLVDYGREFRISSQMRVLNKYSDDFTVNGSRPSNISLLRECLHPWINRRAFKGFKGGKPTSFSIAWPSTGLGNEINNSDADIINLHWLGNNTLSIEEIGNLKKPVVWRLADMWAFCGAEHYVNDDRYIKGYNKKNWSDYDSGIDLNKRTWDRKLRSWKREMHIICPTAWLAECVRNSFLFHDFPVTVIPTAIDTERWKPLDKVMARKLLGLPSDVPLVLFGAMRGTLDPRKGGDLLISALNKLKLDVIGTDLETIQLVIFGQSKPEQAIDFGFPVRYFGHLDDDLSLSLLYASADVMVVPSRQDNLPGTVLESLACGIPVVAFSSCGLPNIVSHRLNGWLAKPFDAEDLAAGIRWILSNNELYRKLSENSREIALKKYSPKVIAESYSNVYNLVLANHENSHK